jgi:N-methylhydantoinase B
MDVRFAMPVWREGQIFCWLSNTGHWPDTGGAVPGGFLASAISAEQEGLRLPPVKLFKKGVLDQEIYQIICSNIRVSEQRIGDVKAQASALLVGAERLAGLLDRYGDATVTEAIAEMRRLAARQMRAMIGLDAGRQLPRARPCRQRRGGQPAPDHRADGDPQGRRLTFDFAGSSPPCLGPMNSVRATTLSSVYLAMRHIFPDVPISAGAFEPLMSPGSKGTFLDAQYPRPVSGCAAEVSQRIAEAVFAALVQAIPDRVTAAPAGPAATSAGRARPGKGPRLCDVPDFGRRLWRQRRGGRHRQRLFDHRHFQGAAGRDHGADLSRPLPPLRAARRLGRGGAAPRRASGWTTRSSCCAARRGPVS